MITSSQTSSIAQLCEEMIQWEEAGDASSFEQLLDAAFRFRRASGAVVNKSEFIADLKNNIGQGRHLVGQVDYQHFEKLVVASLVIANRKKEEFRNLRIFKDDAADGHWTLLMWCNEKI